MAKIEIQEFWVQTPGGRIFVKRWVPCKVDLTDKAPIILFHDSLGCVELWRDFPQTLSLSTQREVIAYDRLGFGRSDTHPKELKNSFISDEAEGSFSALLRTLQLDHFIAFGHSVGGGMATVCAAKFQKLCCGLITESAQAFVEDRTINGIREAKNFFGQEEQFNRLKKYHGEKADWVLSAWVDTWLSDGFRQWNLDESLASLHCPVLAIHGDKDEYGTIKHPERIVSLPNSPTTMMVIPDCGHVPHREKSGDVIEGITLFLAHQAK